MAFKVHEGNVFEKLGLNRIGVAAGVTEMGTSAITSAINAGESSWDENYTTFQHLGMGAAGVASGAYNTMLAAAFGAAIHRRLPREGFSLFGKRFGATSLWDDVYKYKGGIWAAGSNGETQFLKNASWFRRAVPTAPESVDVLRKAGKAGMWEQRAGTALGQGRGSFIKGSRLFSIGGLVATIGGSMLFSWGAEKTFGLAGQLADEAHFAYSQAKMHTYDNRQFNNRSLMGWGMQAQEAAMSTLVPFEQNMMSLARLYHR